MQPPTAIPLTWQHYEPARTVLARAFEDYPLMRQVVPDASHRLTACNALYSGVMRYCLRYGEAFTTPEVAGAACWLPPDRPFPSFLRMVRAGMLSVPLKLGWTAYGRLEAFDRVATQMHQTHAPGPHWYLWVIGVAPERQGQGVGAHLMQPILKRADAARLPCYLETHKQTNTLIYARRGFRIVSESSVPGQPGTVWGMRREPA